jgi:hypothetical protein
MATPQVVTITQDAIEYPIQKVSWDWLCTDLGVVSSAASGWYCGKIVKVSLASDSGGTAPTNLYDVTIEDGDGLDVLSGEGADVTAAATVYINDPTKMLWVRSGTLTLKVAHAGDAKGGVVTLYILRA